MPDAAGMLREGLAALSVPDPERAAGLLGAYMDELERWNPRFGLVNYRSREELVVKHVLDSLSAWTEVRDAVSGGAATVIDVGSGAGLPGIPLAIVLPGVSFTLLERMARRCAFLRTCVLLLRLPNTSVLQKDFRGVRGAFDEVTFRAYAPLDRFIAESRHGGPRWRALVAYKGRKDRAAEEMERARSSLPPGSEAELRPLRTPFLEEERCIVLLRRAAD